MRKYRNSITTLTVATAIFCLASSADAQRLPRESRPAPVASEATTFKVPVVKKITLPGKVIAIQNGINASLMQLASITLTPECEIVDTGPHSNIWHYRTGQVRFKMTGNAPAGTTLYVAGSTGGGQVPFASGTYTVAAGMDPSFVVGIVDANFNAVPVMLDLDGSQPVSTPGSAGWYRWDWDAAPALNECPVGRV